MFVGTKINTNFYVDSFGQYAFKCTNAQCHLGRKNEIAKKNQKKTAIK